MTDPARIARRIVRETLHEAARGEGPKAAAARAELDARAAAQRDAMSAAGRLIGHRLAEVGTAIKGLWVGMAAGYEEAIAHERALVQIAEEIDR